MLSRWSVARPARARFAWISRGPRARRAEEHRLTLCAGGDLDASGSAIAWVVAAVVFGLVNLTYAARTSRRSSWRRSGSAARPPARSPTSYSSAPCARVTALALAARLPGPTDRPRRSRPPAVRLEPRHRGADPRRARRRRRRADEADVDAEYVAAACIFLGVVACGVGLLATHDRRPRDRRPGDLGPRRARPGRGAATSTPTSRSTTAARSACCRPASTGWPTACASASTSATSSAARSASEVARAALRGGARLGGEEREIGAVFVDLVGSTSMALAMPPTEVVRLLNRFFRVVSRSSSARAGSSTSSRATRRCASSAPRSASDDPAGDALRAARASSPSASSARSRDRLRHRGLGGRRGRRQRRLRAALRVHGDRRPGQRGRAPLRARQGAPGAPARLRGGAPRAARARPRPGSSPSAPSFAAASRRPAWHCPGSARRLWRALLAECTFPVEETVKVTLGIGRPARRRCAG